MYAHIALLVDRSGSMDAIKESAEQGLAEFIEKQKDIPGKCTIGIAQFDTQFEEVTRPIPLAEATGITIQPRHATALLDSIGSYVQITDEYLKTTNKPDKVFFVIVTDGLENSSLEWTYDKIAKLIKQKQDEEDWQFVFLAANMDAMAEASRLGMRKGSSMGYEHTKRGMSTAYSAATASVGTFRSGGGWNLPKKADEGGEEEKK